MKNDPKILSVIGNYDGCAMWRVVYPLEELMDKGYPCAFRMRDMADIDKQTTHADIVVINRIYWMPGHQHEMREWFNVIRHMQKTRLVIMDIDDDVITEDSKQHTSLFHHDWTMADAEEHRQANIEALKMCEAITTTTERLAELYRANLDVPVYVLPNSIRWTQWRKTHRAYKPKDIPPGKLVIGWAGGWRVKDDLAPMMEAWKIIAEKYDNVHFMLAGAVHQDYRDMLPPDRVSNRPWVHVNVYPVQYVGMDIACCPIADMPFNYMKSPCKALEAGAAECAVIASPLVYSSVLEHGNTGLLATTVDEWVDGLSRYIEDEKFRKNITRRWSKRVQQRHNAETNCWQWANVYREVYANGLRVPPSDTTRNLAATSLAGQELVLAS